MQDSVFIGIGGHGGLRETAEQLAASITFLLSDDASYMTGEVVSVDGGATTTNSLRPSGGAGRWDPSLLPG